MKRILLIASALSLATSLALAAPIKIGIIETLSGPQASSGQAYRTAVRYGIDQINAAGGWNGSPIQVLEYDNQGGPSGAADKLKAAEADGVQINGRQERHNRSRLPKMNYTKPAGQNTLLIQRCFNLLIQHMVHDVSQHLAWHPRLTSANYPYGH